MKIDNYNGIAFPNHGCRTNHIDWDQYFMTIAFLSAKRSEDPCTQAGACIVNDMKLIVATGYNGMPRRCNNYEFPWPAGTENSLDSESLHVNHAEVNAILNRNICDLSNCTMYMGSFPCNDCVKVIIQFGIKKIMYIKDGDNHKAETIASKTMLDAANVEYRQFTPMMNQITIDFDDIDSDDEE